MIRGHADQQQNTNASMEEQWVVHVLCGTRYVISNKTHVDVWMFHSAWQKKAHVQKIEPPGTK